MPTWKEIANQITEAPSQADQVRRYYMAQLAEYRGRNVIAYYSGWLSKDPSTPAISINDFDMNSFMQAVNKLDCTKGLDLILHTPGGDLAATEQIVCYLRDKFGTDICAIVPQLAMSAGTMIACACKSILMGRQSCLGPIDPQLGGVPAQGVIDEFEQAAEEIQRDPSRAHVWQFVLNKYHPTFLTECSNSIEMSREIVTQWLLTGMFHGKRGKKAKAKAVVDFFSSHSMTKAHGRHIPAAQCRDVGLVVEQIEGDPDLQDIVLSIHHAYMFTFTNSQAIVKIVENHEGQAQMVTLNRN